MFVFECQIISENIHKLKQEEFKYFFTNSRTFKARGGKICFLSGNLGRRLEIFCKICNVTITKITKQMHT
jgi:hypothetical protein